MQALIDVQILFIIGVILGGLYLPLKSAPASCSNLRTSPSSITINIDDLGSVSGDVVLRNPIQQSSVNPSSVSVIFLAIPFQIGDESITASDAKPAILSSSDNFSLLAVLIPSDLITLTFSIDELIPLENTIDGDAKILFDVSYDSVSDEEQEIFNWPTTTSLWDIQIVLPKDYGDAVDIDERFIAKCDEETDFILTSNVIEQNNPGKTSISFPDPRQEKAETAQLIFMIVVGIITGVLSSRDDMRNRKHEWSKYNIIGGVLIAGAAGFFVLTLPNGATFLVWAIQGGLTHAIVTIIVHIYVLLAKHSEVVISGDVVFTRKGKDGKDENGSAEHAFVTLERLDHPSWPFKIKRQETTSGSYKFYVWMWRNLDPSKFKVIVKYDYAVKSKSIEEFTVYRSQKHYPMPQFKFESKNPIRIANIHTSVTSLGPDQSPPRTDSRAV